MPDRVYSCTLRRPTRGYTAVCHRSLHVNPRHLELAPYLADVGQLPDHLTLAAELGPTRREAAAIEARIRSSCDQIHQLAPGTHRRGAAAAVDEQTVDRVLRLLEGGTSISDIHRDLQIQKRTVSRIAAKGRPKSTRCATCGGRCRSTHCKVCDAEHRRKDPYFGMAPRTRQIVEQTGVHPDEAAQPPPAPTLEIPETGWRVCVVVGPAASGKTLAVRDYMADRGGIAKTPGWSQRSVLESLSHMLPLAEICGVLNICGLLPVDLHKQYSQLSASERFRANLAYTLTRHDRGEHPVAIDDFAVDLDGTAARILARDIARSIRSGGLGRCRQILAVTHSRQIAKAFRPDVMCVLSDDAITTKHRRTCQASA